MLSGRYADDQSSVVLLLFPVLKRERPEEGTTLLRAVSDAVRGTDVHLR